MLRLQQLSQVRAGLMNLGARRLAALATAGALIIALVIGGSYMLARPAMQPLYTGLSAQDIGRITGVLAEIGIPFDLNEQRNAVLVPFGQTARARSVLAQKGLPANSRAGYELFDQLGSIGLTSFMQEVTRVRALEGEISRTIQAVDGVAAARVHLVLPDQGSLRRERREPSASVLLRIEDRWQMSSVHAVRHIVAAAIPGMKIEQVSVASTDGRLLATGGDEQMLGSSKLSELEKSMATELEQRAARTLSASLGISNFQISATVRLDVDRQQTNETVFDPKSRVERSVRVVKQSGQTEDGGARSAVGADANIPQEEKAQSESERRRQREDRREELVNYELNTRTVQTVREGYRIQRLAIAVVISRKRLIEGLGQNAGPAEIEARLAELKRIVTAATGANAERGDLIELSAAEFGAADAAIGPVPGPSIKDQLVSNTGTIINALALLCLTFVVIWFGVRPLGRSLAATAAFQDGKEPALQMPAALDKLGVQAAAGIAQDAQPTAGLLDAGKSVDRAGRSIKTRSIASARQRLEQLAGEDGTEVATVLKSWLSEAKSS